MKRSLACPRPHVCLAALLASIALAGCSSGTTADSTLGSARVAVLALSTADVVGVQVTVSGSALPSPRVSSLYAHGGQWGAILGSLPAGSGYTFTAAAKNASGVVIYTGSASAVTVTGGQTVAVVITAQQATPPDPFHNALPVIDSLVIASSSVAPGDQVAVKVAAHDPDAQDTLAYLWQASCGTFASASAINTTWTAPANPGSCTVSIQVTDQHGGKVSASVTVDVNTANGHGQAQVTVTTNTWPVVTIMTASPSGWLDASTPTTLAVTATDADNDSLTYAWTSTCTGAWTSLTAASPIFTLDAGQTGACTFTVTVSDGRGGTTPGSLTLSIGAPAIDQAPVIVASSQSSGSAYFGGTVSLSVQAMDPEGSAVTFQWAASAGALTGQTDDGSNSTVTFTAPSNSDAVWKITVTVRDAQGASNTLDFFVVSQGSADIEFVFTSDAHYGLSKTSFRGTSNASAQVVNQAMVAQINTMAGVVLPNDSGVHASQPVGAVDFVVEGGDVANRMELASSVQTDAASWAQYTNDYINGLTLTDHTGTRAPLITIPGNHDVSNAIGYYKTMSPTIDATSMVAIFNAAMNPTVPRTIATYNYATDKIHFSKTFGGVHFAFVNMWPDSVERAWLASDIAALDPHTPVVIFCHDQPDVETKHLKNPNGDHSVNATDQFENMTEDYALESKISMSSAPDQRNLVAFLKANKNIVAYFHGNSHIQEMVTWTGPDSDIALPVFSVDSPMKGSVSSTDETKLAFNLGSIDVVGKQMTVREVRWNSTKSASSPITFATSAGSRHGVGLSLHPFGPLKPSQASASLACNRKRRAAPGNLDPAAARCRTERACAQAHTAATYVPCQAKPRAHPKPRNRPNPRRLSTRQRFSPREPSRRRSKRRLTRHLGRRSRKRSRRPSRRRSRKAGREAVSPRWRQRNSHRLRIPPSSPEQAART
jgi:Calcineurin-like phosphoesterase/Bacterial Ig domain